MRLSALAAVPLLCLTFAAAPARAADGPRVIQMTVTQDGFVPDEVKVKAGEPVQLVITRKTNKTCATEIVIKDHGIHQKLPLDQAVTVSFTPRKAGKIRYACGMDMIAGQLVVE